MQTGFFPINSLFSKKIDIVEIIFNFGNLIRKQVRWLMMKPVNRYKYIFVVTMHFYIKVGPKHLKSQALLVKILFSVNIYLYNLCQYEI